MTNRLEINMSMGGYPAKVCASMPCKTIPERNDMRVAIPLVQDIAEAVQIFRDATNKIGDPAKEFHRHMVFEECFMNQFIHGNQGNPELLSMARMVIEIHRNDAHRRVSYIVSLDDHAPPFELSTVPDPTDDDNLDKLTGRGLVYIQDIGGATIQQIPRSGGKTMVYAWAEEFSTVLEQATTQDEI